MVSKRKRRKEVSVKVTPENYQIVLLEVLREKKPALLQVLAKGAAQVGIADAEAISKLRDSQWESLLHKLRSIHPNLTDAERKESYDWCIKRGIFPGGHFDYDKDIKTF